jgi:hypothetical protein
MSERAVQISVKARLQWHGLTVFAVPNGGTRNLLEARRMRAEGVTAGVPDLCVLGDDGKTGWIEVKAERGRVSERQAEFHATMRRRGHNIAVVRDQDEAVEVCRQWGMIA